MSHTPAPWEAVSHLVRTVRNADGTGGYLVAECPVWNPHRAEDAALIAAAPDLLEALRGLHDDLMDYIKLNNLGAENNTWLVIARAAIAKAEGPK